MQKTINVKSLVTALRAEDKASGAVTERVRELYAGCKTADDFKARRVLVNQSIDAAVTDKETATKYKARINAVFSKYILPEGMVLTNRGTSKRKATIAAKGKGKGKGTAKGVTNTPVPLHDVNGIMAALQSVVENMTKSDCIAVKTRLENLMSTIIAKK